MLAKMLRRNAEQIKTHQSPAYEPLRRFINATKQQQQV